MKTFIEALKWMAVTLIVLPIMLLWYAIVTFAKGIDAIINDGATAGELLSPSKAKEWLNVKEQEETDSK